MRGDMCGDDRFEVIEQAKKCLLENTNIKDSVKEMEVMDSFLFRCWQMGWLDKFKPNRYAIAKRSGKVIGKVIVLGKLRNVVHNTDSSTIVEDEFVLKLYGGELVNIPESLVGLTPISYEEYIGWKPC